MTNKVIIISPKFHDGSRLSDVLFKIQKLKNELIKSEGEGPFELTYLRADGDSIGSKVGMAFMSNDVKMVQELSERINKGQELIAQWALNNMGQLLMSGGDDVAVIIPANVNINEVEKLREAYLKVVGATLSIGLGDSPHESAQALLLAKLTGKDKIITFTPETEKRLALVSSLDPEYKKLHDEGYLHDKTIEGEESINPNESGIDHSDSDEVDLDLTPEEVYQHSSHRIE